MNYINCLPKDLIWIVLVMKAYGINLRLVGGAVRDINLDLTPKDFDLSSDASPKELSSILNIRGIKNIASGIRFGTISVKPLNQWYEITSMREESGYDGRRPQKVIFIKDWLSDLRRRDFTFNAMLVEIPSGKLRDPFNGVSDLLSGRVKFVGSFVERIKEDRLRIIRYLRFNVAFGKIGWSWARKKLSNFSLKKIPESRIYSEFFKLFLREENNLTKLKNLSLRGINLNWSYSGLKLAEKSKFLTSFLKERERVGLRMLISVKGEIKSLTNLMPETLSWLKKSWDLGESTITSRFDIWKIFFNNRGDKLRALIQSLKFLLRGREENLWPKFKLSLLFYLGDGKFWPSFKGEKINPKGIENLKKWIEKRGKVPSFNRMRAIVKWKI